MLLIFISLLLLVAAIAVMGGAAEPGKGWRLAATLLGWGVLTWYGLDGLIADPSPWRFLAVLLSIGIIGLLHD